MEQGRWLSDEEKIEAVIYRYLLYYPYILVNLNGKEPIENKNPATRYESIEDFMEKNPDCCAVYAGSSNTEIPNPDFWSRVYGYYSGVVVVKSSNNYIKFNGENTMESSFLIDNCGENYSF